MGGVGRGTRGRAQGGAAEEFQWFPGWWWGEGSSGTPPATSHSAEEAGTVGRLQANGSSRPPAGGYLWTAGNPSPWRGGPGRLAGRAMAPLAASVHPAAREASPEGCAVGTAGLPAPRGVQRRRPLGRPSLRPGADRGLRAVGGAGLLAPRDPRKVWGWARAQGSPAGGAALRTGGSSVGGKRPEAGCCWGPWGGAARCEGEAGQPHVGAVGPGAHRLQVDLLFGRFLCICG